jgi:O-acetyl-ADP-ribose deacetylase (regulator of RNase III)
MSQYNDIQVIEDGITRVKSDAIVNAANTLPRAGGGVR